MGSRLDLLDELARVHARAAVEEFLATCRRENIEPPPSVTNAPIDGDGCKLTAEQLVYQMGSEP
jgi:hypothetical protein